MPLLPTLTFVALLLSALSAVADSNLSQSPPCEQNSNALPPAGDTSIPKISCAASHPTRDEIKAIIKDTLQPHVFSLKRSVKLYHYGENPNHTSGPVAIDDQKLAQKYFYDESTGRDYFNPDPSKGYQFYTASNPLVSLDYATIAGKNSLLLEITVPPGIRYLDENSLALTPEKAMLVHCYLEAQKPTPAGSFESRLKPYLDPGEFIHRSTEANSIVKEAFSELHIQLILGAFREALFKECPGINPEVKFIDPSLSSRLKFALYTDSLEPNASPEKKAAYAQILKYFDIATTDEIANLETSARPNFWHFYKTWVSVLHSLPPNTNWNKFHRQKSQKAQASRQSLVSSLMGCSPNPQFRDEILKPAPRLAP